MVTFTFIVLATALGIRLARWIMLFASIGDVFDIDPASNSFDMIELSTHGTYIWEGREDFDGESLPTSRDVTDEVRRLIGISADLAAVKKELLDLRSRRSWEEMSAVQDPTTPEMMMGRY